MTAGVLGAVIATTSVILPSYVLVIIISKLLEKFKSNKKVQAAIYGLKPAGCGLLSAVALNIFKDNVTELFAFFFFAVLLGLSFKQKRDPLFYLGVSAVVGLAAGFLHLT